MTEITFKFVIELSEETREFIKEMVNELHYEEEDNDDDEN